MSATTFYQRKYVGWPPVRIGEYSNPNSAYWKERAIVQGYALLDKIGEERYAELVDRQPDDITWRALHELFSSELEKIHVAR